ncbi:MAG: tetratricopeptide repeat protein, partial [Dokdonella sp.]
MIGQCLGWIRYVAFALAMQTSAHAAETVDVLLARGECSAALTIVRAAVADEGSRAATRHADALAEASRVGLDCAGVDPDELDGWLARELALRMPSGADSPAVGKVELKQARRDLQRNKTEVAFESLRALDVRASSSHWPAGLRAQIFDQLSAIHNMRAEGPAAFAAAGRAIDLARSVGDRATLEQALGNRAFALLRMRRGAEALLVLVEAEHIARELYGANSLDRAEILRRTGQAQRELGDFGSAIGSLEQALAIQRAQVDPVPRRIANVLLTLGQTLKMSGDSERALTRYEEALAAEDEGADPNSRLRPVILHALANLHRDSDRNALSIPLYAQAVTTFETIYGAQSAQLAQLLNNYANAEANLGRYDAAVEKYRRSLAITKALQSGDPADVLPLSNIAMIEVWRGRHVQAEADFRATIAALQDVAAGSESSALFPMIGLAASLWGQQRFDEAFAAAVDAEYLREAALRLAAGRLAEHHAMGYQEYLRPSLDFVIAIAAASGKTEHIERAWELSIAARDQVTAV